MIFRPLKIAHIDTERTWRGGEQQLVSLVEALKERSHENIVVGRTESALSMKLASLNVPYLPIDPMGEWDWIAARRLRSQLKRNAVDVVHAHTSHGIALAVLATRGFNMPVVATRRVDFALRGSWLSRIKYRRVDRLVAVSQAVREVSIAGGIPAEKVAIIPDGIDFRRVDAVVPVAKADLGFPEPSVVVGQVAALAPHKDQSTLLRAISLLRARNPNLRSVLVGEGECRKRLEKQCQELGLQSIVRFLGFQSEPLRYLAAFDVFCLSSKEEGLGSSLLDAMALNVPVVATRVGGIPDVIEHGITGRLAAGANADALADALQNAIDNLGKDGEMLRLANQRCRAYDMRRIAAEMESVYESMITPECFAPDATTTPPHAD